MTTALADFFRYNLWANQRLLDACAALADAQLDATTRGTYGSIRQTLMHLISSEETYALHCMGSAPTPRLKVNDPFPGFAELRRRAELAANALLAVVEQDDAGRALLLDEGTYEVTVGIVLLQVIDHGIDHRSQIAMLLSVQGIEPPDLDGWSYNDALHAQ